MPWDGRVTAARGGDRNLCYRRCDVRHVAGDGEEHLVARRQQARLETGKRSGGSLAVEDHAVRHELLHLLRLAERDHHLRERWSEPFHHVAQEHGLPHLDPRLGPAHAPAIPARKHEQRGFHHDKCPL